MPDPAAVIAEMREMLGMFWQLGELRDSVQDDDDAIRFKARIELLVYRAKRGELSDKVVDFLLDLLDGAGKTSSSKSKKGARDQVLVFMIEQMEKRGISPTRNPTSEHPCGCSILSELLSELGVSLGERGVQEVWRQRDSHRPAMLPPTPLMPPVRD
jgi:hypothetical protein